MTSKSELNESNKQILSWEDELEMLNSPIKGGKRKTKEKITANDMENVDDMVVVETFKKSAPEKKEKMELSSDPLMKDAREKLNYYLKKIPTYSSLDAQAKLLQVEMNNYKRNGNTENYEKCVAYLKTIQEKSSEIKNVFIPAQGEKARLKNKENYEKIKSSPVIKELLVKEKNIKDSLAKNSTSKIIDRVSQIRKLMKISESSEEIIDFDEYNFEKDQKLYDSYDEILNTVSEITGFLVSELKEMPTSTIRTHLSENIDNSELDYELKAIRAQIEDEKENIRGVLTLTNIINKIYDIKDNEQDEVKVKEILASTHIPMVKNIAYNTCNKGGMFNEIHYKDCVSAGLLALTGTINKWIQMQKIFPTSLSFNGWARIGVQNAIKREMLLLQSGGRMSGSRMADMMTRENRKLATFIEHNPQYAEFDKEIVLDIILGLETEELNKNSSKKNKKVLSTRDTRTIVSQSDIVNPGEDADEGNDIWSTIVKDEVTDITEAKSEYSELLHSINELLKSMDKYDRRLFMMYYGFEKKPERFDDGNTTANKYKQHEMAQELYNMYIANNITPTKAANGTFSQPAISYRITKMTDEIAKILNDRPELKKGFEFLMTYWMDRSDMLETMSNNREELGMKFERDTLRDLYSDDEDVLNIQLSDGKKLMDQFDISDSNPLDGDDIFNIM